MKWKPTAKVTAGGTAWAIGYIAVFALEAAGVSIGAERAVALTGAVAGVAAWAVPEPAPWNRDR